MILLDPSETGPSFTILTTSPDTSSRSIPTGLARIWIQDQDIVSTQFVDVTVTL